MLSKGKTLLELSHPIPPFTLHIRTLRPRMLGRLTRGHPASFTTTNPINRVGVQTQVLCSQNPVLPSSPHTLLETLPEPQGLELEDGVGLLGHFIVGAATGRRFPPWQGIQVGQGGQVGRQPWLRSERSGFPWMLFPARPARGD